MVCRHAHQVPEDHPLFERARSDRQGLLRAADRQLPAALPDPRRRGGCGLGRGAALWPRRLARLPPHPDRDGPCAGRLGARQRRPPEPGRVQPRQPHGLLHLALPDRGGCPCRGLRLDVGPVAPRARHAHRAQRAPHLAALPLEPPGHDRPVDHRGVRSDRPPRALPRRPRSPGPRRRHRPRLRAPDSQLLPPHGHR